MQIKWKCKLKIGICRESCICKRSANWTWKFWVFWVQIEWKCKRKTPIMSKNCICKRSGNANHQSQNRGKFPLVPPGNTVPFWAKKSRSKVRGSKGTKCLFGIFFPKSRHFCQKIFRRLRRRSKKTPSKVQKAQSAFSDNPKKSIYMDPFFKPSKKNSKEGPKGTIVKNFRRLRRRKRH